MAEILGILFTIIFIFLGGMVVSGIFSASRLTPLATPAGVPDELWEALRHSGTEAQGKWLGMLERTISAVAGWTHAYELAAGWLAFKVASKWEVWSNVLRLPESFPGVEPLPWLRARRQWGANLLMRFLTGTISNVLLGFAAAYLGKALGALAAAALFSG